MINIETLKWEQTNIKAILDSGDKVMNQGIMRGF